MCFPYDAEPPIARLAGGSVEHTDLTLESEDGNTFSAFLAEGDGSREASVVVLPDVRGLFKFYEELALRFADQNIDAVAIDYFGRTAGLEKRGADFEWQEHVAQSTFNGVMSDVAAAVAYLRKSNPDRPVFTLGFCFGGSNSWHQAANGLDLAGAVGFYGHPNRPEFPQNAPGVQQRVTDISCPILGLMGGADQGIPKEIVSEFEQELKQQGVESEIVIYDGAPHSFFDRHYEEFSDQSADAWSRVLKFISSHAD